MTLYIYRFLTILLSPLIDLFLFFRLLKGKEDKTRFFERLGYSKLKRPSGKVIWIQCASVGEANSAMLLIDRLIEIYSNKVTILLTTGTKTSAAIVAKKIATKPNIVHQYTPVDKYFVIRRFLKHWRPEALITIESELWPNMITMSHKVTGKVIMVNAKISERSLKRWLKFKDMKNKIFGSIDICYPQSKVDEERLNKLGVNKTKFLGNLKFDVNKCKVNDEYVKMLSASLEGRTTLMCASSHGGEDKIILSLYQKLKKNFQDLIFIVAIRHPSRSNEVFDFYTSNKMNVKRKSLGEKPDQNTNMYVYDEMGEMGSLFEVSDVVLMCGSLIDKIGGHTPVEPGKQSCAIVSGPYVFNSHSLYSELEKNDACIVVEDKNNLDNNLYNTISSLLSDKEKIGKMKTNALDTCNRFSNVTNEVANDLAKNI